VAVTIRPTPSQPTLLDSLSAYYYSSGVAVVEGLLVALALFLFAYDGYPGKYHWADWWAAKVAAVAAIVIALCPTYPPGYPHPSEILPAPPWWREWNGKIHDGASFAMFVLFAVFSLWLFRLTDPTKGNRSRDKRRRDNIYLGCGVLIVASSVSVFILFKTGNTNVLLPECMAIGAFSFSWMVKGGLLARWLPD
jgi:Protein of unknown function (DUF998)